MFLIPLALSALGASTLVTTLASLAVSVVSALTQKKPKAADPQAQALTVQMGESPRRAVVGKAWTAGTFMFGFNAGAKNIDEWVLYKFADHPINDFEGFLVGEDYNGFAGDGAQPAFTVSGTAHLNMYFLDGTQTTVPAAVLSAAGAKWNSAWIMKGCAGVWIHYRANQKVWVSGRPSFRFYLGGAKVYDPRHDSTVTGGSGAQRWDNYSTYVYSENIAVLALNYRLGIYNGTDRTHLMVGRGLTLAQALGTTGAALAQYIAAANVCDESVALKAGGTHTRYSGGLVIDANEDYDTVLQKFADGCAGDVVPRAGRLSILPGGSQTPHDGFTDDDLVAGEAIEFSAWLPEPERVNTVVATYAGLEQRGNDASVTRRVFADLQTDGSTTNPRPFEMPLRLDAIYDNIRAQGIAEIRRRQGRLERRATITLPARYANLEVGDWIPWTSTYCLGGDTVTFQVVREEFRIGRSKRVTLREIQDEVYDWTAATDELDPGQQVPDPQTIDDLDVAGFSVSALLVGGLPAIKAEWTAPGVTAANRLILQIREDGTTEVASVVITDSDTIAAGVYLLTNGVGSNLNMEVRARYDSDDRSRETPWTTWAAVSTDGLISDDSTKPTGNANRVRYSLMEAGTTGFNNAADAGVTVTSFIANTLLGRRYIQLAATMPATAGKKMLIQTPSFVVTAGERISCQTRLETTGPCSQTDGYINFYDSAGGGVGSPVLFDTEPGVAPFYAAWMLGFVDAPSGAVTASMSIQFVSTAAGGAATLSIIEPMVTGASAAQTAHPAFTAGPSNAEDGETRLTDVETQVTAINATGLKTIGSLTEGAPTNIGGTSWITLQTAALTGLTAGSAEFGGSGVGPEGGTIGGMSGGTSMAVNVRIAHQPTSGGTLVALASTTGTINEIASGFDPSEVTFAPLSAVPVPLTYTGDVTFLLQIQRTSGATGQDDFVGVLIGLYRPT